MSEEKLVVLTGPLREREYPIDGRLTIGRNPDSDLHLDDLQISRKHALIEQSDKGTILRDLGSGNGTFVGDRRVLEYKLSHGDVIRMGTQELRFESTAVPSETPAPPAVKSDSGVRFAAASGDERVESADAANVYETFFAAPKSTATEDQLRQTQERLQAVYEALRTISSEQNLKRLLEKTMDQIFTLVHAHNGVIILKDEDTGELVTEYIKSGQQDQDITISQTIVNRALEKGEAVITYDAAGDARFEAGASIFSQNISSAMCVPLTHQDLCLGVIYVDTRGTTNAFVTGDLELLVALAGGAATAIRNVQFWEGQKRAYNDMLIGLANAVEMRDHYTVGHTWRVTNFTLAIAREMGWTEEKLEEVRMGVVLHDVGKIAVPDGILLKASKLTDEEYEQIKVHPERGAEMMRDIKFLHPLIPYCLYHHERWDGKGYPYKLAGDKIPIEGRVVAVADTFDALTSNRPYRKGFPAEKGISIIEEGRGTQFDPEVVDALLKAYRGGKIDQVLQDYYATDEKSVACPFCSTHIRTPEDKEVGDTFECHVCHRTIRLGFKNDAYFGERVSASGGYSPTPAAPTP